MKIETYIVALISYATMRELIRPEDHDVAVNKLLEILQLDDYTPSDEQLPGELEEILMGLLDYACSRGLCQDNVTARDLFDTKLMGALTPFPREVHAAFRARYAQDPAAATDWYYQLCQNTDYIRHYRIAKDMRWTYRSPYGDLDVTINLSKPEKDPRAIAAAKLAPQSGYPKCALCAENAGYAGRMNHPARQNHRPVPLRLQGENWFFQYSPYVYYNEHCIVFNARHTPMVIDRSAFAKLLEFVEQFPHYFLGSNADLPIVGGSILSHEHFQGGRYEFAMAKAPMERRLSFPDFPQVAAGIVKWPMSVLRLQSAEPEPLIALADRILAAWRGYTDEKAFLFAETDGEPHNAITPIARKRGELLELDLVLRNNITTEEFPLGVFHPHPELHHIKKENIGLIEVMGLAVLPSRLKTELAGLEQAIVKRRDIRTDVTLAKHADWVDGLKQQYVFTPATTRKILLRETGKVFSRVLEDAGVFKRTPEGQAAFLRFLTSAGSTQ